MICRVWEPILTGPANVRPPEEMLTQALPVRLVLPEIVLKPVVLKMAPSAVPPAVEPFPERERLFWRLNGDWVPETRIARVSVALLPIVQSPPAVEGMLAGLVSEVVPALRVVAPV